VYLIHTDGAEKVLYNFTGLPYGDGDDSLAPLIDVNGTFYGTTHGGGNGGGTVFALTP
jgi:hypothetical protein